MLFPSREGPARPGFCAGIRDVREVSDKGQGGRQMAPRRAATRDDRLFATIPPPSLSTTWARRLMNGRAHFRIRSPTRQCRCRDAPCRAPIVGSVSEKSFVYVRGFADVDVAADKVAGRLRSARLPGRIPARQVWTSQNVQTPTRAQPKRRCPACSPRSFARRSSSSGHGHSSRRRLKV